MPKIVREGTKPSVFEGKNGSFVFHICGLKTIFLSLTVMGLFLGSGYYFFYY